jgi:outer membrane protein
MSKIIKTAVALSVAGLAAMLAAPAAMAEKGDWIIRGGATMVDPKSNNLRLGDVTDDVGGLVATDATVEVDDGTSFGFNVTYMLTDNIGIELLAAYPFNHDIDLCLTPVGGSRGCVGFGETDHLPPTLSAQWHFMPDSQFQPYVGLGINWTIFSSEKLTGDAVDLLESLGVADPGIKLDDSVGIAAQIGLDWYFNEKWLVNADIRYIEIRSDLDLCGDGVCEKAGEVKIDPMVYSIMIGYKF